MSATASLSYVYDGRQCVGRVIGRGTTFASCRIGSISSLEFLARQNANASELAPIEKAFAEAGVPSGDFADFWALSKRHLNA
jgi:hypothetical protein